MHFSVNFVNMLVFCFVPFLWVVGALKDLKTLGKGRVKNRSLYSNVFVCNIE